MNHNKAHDQYEGIKKEKRKKPHLRELSELINQN